jgi:hypothetical protein
MKPIENYEAVQASSGEFARPTAGGYICMITNVEDVPYDVATDKGNYLKIEYDIATGDFKGYYSDAFQKFGGSWWAKFVRSYKESAVGMFKHFTNCVEASNGGYKWDWNEQGLRGKLIGLVFGEEEYVGNDGAIKTRLVVTHIKTVEEIKNGDFKIPEIKRLPASVVDAVSSSAPVGIDDDVPF